MFYTISNNSYYTLYLDIKFVINLNKKIYITLDKSNCPIFSII